MLIKINIPSPGESINQVQLSALLVKNGSFVEKDMEIAEIDSDKATLPVFAKEAGIINFLASEGDTIDVGAVLCTIDTSANVSEKPSINNGFIEEENIIIDTNKKTENLNEKPSSIVDKNLNISPLARLLMKENSITEDEFINQLKNIRFGKKEVQNILDNKAAKKVEDKSLISEDSENIERKKMSSLRIKLSERLVAAKNQTAMLTTFNEINMNELMILRAKNKDNFKEKHGIPLGYMSFFCKAASIALQQFPVINSQIDGDEIIHFNYTDIGVAVSTQKGLMVPVVKKIEKKSIAEIEKEIFELAKKARNNRISMDELTGGTFTITNGGVFGSLLSTPIINTPQSAILGMHNIVERPIAVNGEVKVAPMMYIALSYDHRVIDGKDSVGFLLKIKELIEHPEHLLFGSSHPINILLDL